MEFGFRETMLDMPCMQRTIDFRIQGKCFTQTRRVRSFYLNIYKDSVVQNRRSFTLHSPSSKPFGSVIHRPPAPLPL